MQILLSCLTWIFTQNWRTIYCSQQKKWPSLSQRRNYWKYIIDIQLLQRRYTCGRKKFDLVGVLEDFILKVLICSSENLVPLPSSFLHSTAWALPGHQGYLPCDIEAESAHEQLYTVLWYKGDDGEPIYTVDAHTSDRLGQPPGVRRSQEDCDLAWVWWPRLIHFNIAIHTAYRTRLWEPELMGNKFTGLYGITLHIKHCPIFINFTCFWLHPVKSDW